MRTTPPPLRRKVELRAACLNSVEAGFNYVCLRCDVWGRMSSGSRRCWSCDRNDRLERR